MKKHTKQRSKQKAPDAVIALDLGTRVIKAVLMRRTRSGNTIEGHQLIGVTGESKSSSDLLELALTKLKGTLLRKTSHITVGLGGHECWITLRELPAADPSDLRKVIRRAPAQIFKENCENLAFDCSTLGAPLSGLASQKCKTLITAIPRERSEALGKIAAKHGCSLCALTVSEISAMESAAATYGASGGSIAILDIGSQASTLSILQNGELAFVRASFETSPAPQCENLHGDINPLSPEKLKEHFSGAMASLAVELRSSLDYFEHNHGSRPGVIYVTGAAGSHRGMLDLLQREIGIKIKACEFALEIRLNTSAEEGELIQRNSAQLLAAVTEGDRLLKANAGLDLLAEQREILLERNAKPLRSVFVVCTALVVSVVGWGAFQQAQAVQLQNDLIATQSATSKLIPEAGLALETVAKVADAKETLNSIRAQANARFLYAPVLGAMQDVRLENVELTKLRIQEEVVQTAVSRGYTNQNKKFIAAQPARVIRRNTVVLEAKQSGTAPVETLLASIKQQNWFKASLRRIDPVLLKELISQNVDGVKESMLKIEAYAEKDLQ